MQTLTLTSPLPLKKLIIYLNYIIASDTFHLLPAHTHLNARIPHDINRVVIPAMCFGAKFISKLIDYQRSSPQAAEAGSNLGQASTGESLPP
jgi:hypothetical protein